MGRKKGVAKESAQKKKPITIEVKKEIISKYDRGVRVVDLARQYNRTTSTICTILKKKEQLNNVTTAKGVSMLSRQRTSVHEEMETLLLLWINEKQLAGDSPRDTTICEKARALYGDLLNQKPGTSTEEIPAGAFKASRGWFENFKRRTGISGGVRHGEASSSDKKAAEDGELFSKKRRTYITAEKTMPGNEPMKDLPIFKNVDTLLRCTICFDFLNTSMMTKCSHNFCSLCIRKLFSYKLQCPVCNLPSTEQDLRNNRLLDDLVVAFRATRQLLSKAIFESPPISPKTRTSAVKCKTPREPGQKHNTSVLSHFFQKRPKTSPTEVTQEDGPVTQSVQHGETEIVCTHNANEAELHLASALTHPAVVVKEEPTDGEEASIQGLMTVKQEDTDWHSASPEAEMAHSSSPPDDIKLIIKVECPVCSVSVSLQFINKHLDMCLNSAKTESLRSSLSMARRPMGKLVYNLLSIQELRRRLKECHLSVKGSRDQLIKRHQEFVHMYNAQCDSLNPKSAEVIAKEVEADEKIRNQLQGKTKPVMVFSMNQTEEEIDEMHSNYRKQHSSDFSRLIAQVQGRLEATNQTSIKQEVTVEEENAPTTHSEDPESKSFIIVCVEDGEAEEEPSTSIKFSLSPARSDVSISRVKEPLYEMNAAEP